MSTINKETLFEEFLEFLKNKGIDLYSRDIQMFKTTCSEFDVSEINVGTVIKFELSTGESVSATAVRDDGDSFLFVFDNALEERYVMNDDGNNNNFDDMKDYLNVVLSWFPSKLKQSVTNIRLLTVGEVFGKSDECYIYDDDEPDQLAYFKGRKNRIATAGQDSNYLTWWWLSNRAKNSASYFAGVDNYGYAYCGHASVTGGVRPAFSVSNAGM